jgi:ABC-type transporter MlaC component
MKTDPSQITPEDRQSYIESFKSLMRTAYTYVSLIERAPMYHDDAESKAAKKALKDAVEALERSIKYKGEL